MGELKPLFMQFKKVSFLKNKFLLILLVIFLSVLVGCFGSKQNKSTTVSSHKLYNKSSVGFYRKDKSVIRVCQGETPPETLDPISFDNKVDEITFHIFDRMVKWNSKGQIVLDLANSIKFINNRTYQFKLRQGIYFHNGEVFDAKSVKFSIERIIDPKTQSPGYSLLKSISRVDIIDPYTVNIVTLKPDYLFIRKLSLVQILPYNYFNKLGAERFGKYPVGTGAYKFEKRLDNSIILTKNDNYWRKDKPKIKTVIFKFIATNKLSRKEQLEALFSGEVDLLTELPGIYSLKVSKNPTTKVIKMPNQSKVHKMLFNSLKEPFSDIRIRRAVNLALNRDILIKVLAKGNGRKIATNSVKLEFGHNPSLEPYPYNLQKARALIKEAGYTNIHIKIAVTEETALIAQAVKKDLERLNFTSDIDVMTISEMAKTLANSKLNKSAKWDYDLTIYSGVDPFMHVGFLYGLALYSQGSWSLTKNNEVDRIYEKLKTTLNDQEQLKLCYKLEELSYNNYWYTPVFQVVGTYGTAKDLQLPSSVTSFVDLTHAYFK